MEYLLHLHLHVNAFHALPCLLCGMTFLYAEQRDWGTLWWNSKATKTIIKSKNETFLDYYYHSDCGLSICTYSFSVAFLCISFLFFHFFLFVYAVFIVIQSTFEKTDKLDLYCIVLLVSIAFSDITHVHINQIEIHSKWNSWPWSLCDTSHTLVPTISWLSRYQRTKKTVGNWYVIVERIFAIATNTEHCIMSHYHCYRLKLLSMKLIYGQWYMK